MRPASVDPSTEYALRLVGNGNTPMRKALVTHEKKAWVQLK